jgi:hypothetical protein
MLDLHIGAVGMEYQLPADFVSGASLFAEGRIGEEDYGSVLGGIRIAFGAGEKSLIRRHREDDPTNHLPDDLFDIGCDGIFDPFDGICFPRRRAR